MKEGWIRIFRADDLLQVKLAEDVLKQAGIESHIVTKPDSVFPISETELYTVADKATAAIEVLRKSDFNVD